MPSVNPGPAALTTQQTQAVVMPQNTPYRPVEPGSNALRLLAVAKGVNVNALGDVAAMLIVNADRYSVFQVVFTNASISLTTALAGVFTAPAAGGTAIVANAALSALTGPTIVSQRTVASTAAITISTGGSNTLYVNVGTAQGAAATMDVYVYGYDQSA